jgi:hypothetical protein
MFTRSCDEGFEPLNSHIEPIHTVALRAYNSVHAGVEAQDP